MRIYFEKIPVFIPIYTNFSPNSPNSEATFIKLFFFWSFILLKMLLFYNVSSKIVKFCSKLYFLADVSFDNTVVS